MIGPIFMQKSKLIGGGGTNPYYKLIIFVSVVDVILYSMHLPLYGNVIRFDISR